MVNKLNCYNTRSEMNSDCEKSQNSDFEEGSDFDYENDFCSEEIFEFDNESNSKASDDSDMVNKLNCHSTRNEMNSDWEKSENSDFEEVSDFDYENYFSSEDIVEFDNDSHSKANDDSDIVNKLNCYNTRNEMNSDWEKSENSDFDYDNYFCSEEIDKFDNKSNSRPNDMLKSNDLNIIQNHRVDSQKSVESDFFNNESEIDFGHTKSDKRESIGEKLNKNKYTNNMPTASCQTTLLNEDHRKYKCCMCGKKFKLKHHLNQHILTHTYSRNRADRTQTCSICSKRFKLKHHLERHILTHTREKKYKCDLCEKRYVDKHDLKIHLKKHLTLPEKEQLKCKYCLKVFYNDFTYKKHILYHKTSCNLCGKNFRSSRYLKYHLRVHTKLVSFSCDVCGKYFPFKSSLDEHYRIHSGDKPFQCDVCQRTFSTKSNLIRHSKSHSKLYSCEHCDLQFTDRKQLQNHLKLCVIKYKCKKCDKIFKKSSNFKRHLKVHAKYVKSESNIDGVTINEFAVVMNS